MSDSAWDQLDLGARRATPVLVTLLTVLVGRLPLYIPHADAIMPWLTLIAVFYWAAHQPGLLPMLAVFAVGVVHDILVGSTVGVGTLVLMLVYGLVSAQRRFFVSRSFFVVWIVFACVAALAVSLHWALTMAAAGAALAPEPALFRMLTTVAFYPLMSLVLVPIHRASVR